MNNIYFDFSGGPVVRLKGSITSMSFLDSYGSIIPYTFEPWRDENRDKKDRKLYEISIRRSVDKLTNLSLSLSPSRHAH